MIIIALVMFATYYAVIESFYDLAGIKGTLGYTGLAILALATILSAASGYIINDCFDMNVDSVNKPEKVTVGKNFSYKGAMRIYYVINALIVILGFIAAFRVGAWRLGMLFPMGIILMWLYSARYKSSVLVGNIVVSFLSGMVIVIVWLFEFFSLLRNAGQFVAVTPYLSVITWYILTFGAFAFLISMSREIVKDAEDIEGDTQSGIETYASKYGTNASNNFTTIILVTTSLIIAAVSFYFFTNNMLFAGLYYSVVLLPLMIYVIFKIRYARKKADYSLISTLLKVIMVAGIIGLQPITMSL